MARPPWRWPTTAEAKRTMVAATPARSKMRPAITNTGMAMRGYLAMPV